MNPYNELQQARKRVWEQAKGIAERACKRGSGSILTPVEERQFDSLVAELDRLTAEQRTLDYGARITAPRKRDQDPRLRLTELLGKRYPPELQTPLQQIVELQRRRGKWNDE